MTDTNRGKPPVNEAFHPIPGQSMLLASPLEDHRPQAANLHAGKHFGIFDVDESFEIILDLKARPRERLRRWIKKFRREKIRSP